MYHRATLPNGLRVIGEDMPYIHSVSLGLWVGAGSRDEPAGWEGISHLIEHMFFKGTQRRSAREIAETIDAVGGQLNAFTTREYTCYYAKVLSTHLPLGLELLAEMFTSSALDEGELAKEKDVILEEIKSYEDAPDELVHDLLAAALWPRHPLGRPILGTPASITALTGSDLREYLRLHYEPHNTVLAVAGRMDFDQVCEMAARHLSQPCTGSVRPVQVPPRPDPTRLIRTKDTEQVHLCLGGPGVERANTDKYAVLVLDSILGGSVSSRLFQKLREERGLVYAVGSTHTSFRDTGLFSIYAGTALDRAAEVIGLIVEEIERLQLERIDDAELARAKDQLRGNFLLGMESTSTRMSRLAKAELFRDEVLTPEEVAARVDAVTAADVSRLARAVFGGSLPAAAVAPPKARACLDSLFCREVP
ncbi:MAG: M16 family metallopeptidase [Patescibacteria group bacterium]